MLKVIIILTTMLFSPVLCSALSRTVPTRPEVESFAISFNNENIQGFGTIIDARTPGEKDADEKRGAPAGPVIVFFQGHAQRPDDAFEFTSKLALLSRSGLVIVPVCDTPFGSDTHLHGDNGKEVVLMEMVRFMLAREGIAVSGYTPAGSTVASVNTVYLAPGEESTGTFLVSVGWSHGGILARRFAHAYPGSVCWLGQVCPAGYGDWGSWRLIGRFAGESLKISADAFPGQTSQALRSGWGFTKGFFGDFIRSVPLAIRDLQVKKMGRVAKDIKDCTLSCDSSKFRAAHLNRIAVLFGKDDSCMNQWKQLGIKDTDHVSEDELKLFQEKYFSDTIESGTVLALRIVPGNHLAPVLHSDLFARELLSHLDQGIDP